MVKKRHSVKSLLIVCILTGLIVRVYSYKGRIHDFALFKKSKTIFHHSIEVITDLGFLGLQKLHEKTRMPHRATKLKALTKVQKKENRAIAQKRVLSEHKNRQCKIFRITKDLYRGKHKNYGLNWNLVAAIVNLKTAALHLRYAKP